MPSPAFPEPKVILAHSVVCAETDEVMVTTIVHDPAARLRSYELVAGG